MLPALPYLFLALLMHNTAHPNARYAPLPQELFIDGRQRLRSHLPQGAIAILVSGDEMPRSADQKYPYRPNPDLFRLTGIDQEDTLLVICPDAHPPHHREILFIRESNPEVAVWEGHKLTKEEARALSGIQTVYWTSEFEKITHELIIRSTSIFLGLNENVRAHTDVPVREWRFVRQLKDKYPLHNYGRLGPIMDEIRSIKHPAEVETIRRACDITGRAFERVLRFVKPGVREYEVEAEITHEFIRSGANGHAYQPIIASGPNACVLHYNANNGVCQEGHLLLLDFGAEYAHYASDLSRTIPVNGRFTPRQRAVYEAVLRVMQYAKSLLRPGTLYSDYEKQVGACMTEELIGLGLLKKEDVAAQNPQQPLYKKYYMHGTSHFLGLDVHDSGNRNLPMRAGMIFTCEPGIYIPEEGIGIRLENDIYISEQGPVDLMADIPLAPDDIEECMKNP